MISDPFPCKFSPLDTENHKKVRLEVASLRARNYYNSARRWFSQGTRFSVAILVNLIAIARTSLSSCNNPGPRSPVYVFLDAF